MGTLVCCNRECGVCTVLDKACSLMVCIFTACVVTMHWCAPARTGVRVVIMPCWGWTRVSAEFLVRLLPRGGARSGGSGSIMHGGVMIPGVLLHVMQQWSLGVVQSVHFDVGFHVCMIGRAFKMHGTVSMIGVSLTTLSSSTSSPGATLCCRAGGDGVRIFLIHVARSLSNRLPSKVPFARGVVLVSSLVKAQKCCTVVKEGSWQCWGNSSDKPKIW